MPQELTVVTSHGEPRIDSRLAATFLRRIEHEVCIRTLRTYQGSLTVLGILRFETGEIKGCRQPQKYVMPNGDQVIGSRLSAAAILLAMESAR
jgi:hypothetical protein